MSVDTLVSIIDMVLQAIALGLAIMMAIYGNNVKQCFKYCLHSILLINEQCSF